MTNLGKITKWNDEKGFGFIAPDNSEKEVFFHISNIKNQSIRPKFNQKVSYILSNDTQNREYAKNIILLPQKNLKKPKGFYSIIFGLSFLSGLGIAVFKEKLPITILYAYLITSFLAFIQYAIDKSAAKKNKWRTPENTLHFIALIGGWPGALIAQQILRHKSKKVSFRIVFWITVIINCGALTWHLFPRSIDYLHSLIASILNI